MKERTAAARLYAKQVRARRYLTSRGITQVKSLYDPKIKL